MHKPLKIEDLPSIGEALLESAASVPPDPAVWDNAENARLRSAVNRAYYGVFLYLKAKLEPRRAGWQFPRRSIHRHLRMALENALSASHPLSQAVRLLQRERGRADYVPNDAFTKTEVEDLLDVGWGALEEAQQLTPSDLTSIANELFDLDRLAGN